MKAQATRQTSQPSGSANGDPGNIHMGTHTHTVTVPSHTHTVQVTVPSHSHSVSIDIPAHSHSVSIDIPAHSHDVRYNIPSHTHSVDIEGHSHTVGVTIPSHSHNIIHGIYDYPNLATCQIYIDGKLIADNVTGDRNINIAQYLNTPYGGQHTLEIRSKATTNNPNGLGRANVALMISGFVSF